MKHLVSYSKTAEDYSLLYNGEVVAQIDPLVTETDAKDLVKNINESIKFANDTNLVVVQNDNDCQGVIVDIYTKDGEEYLDGSAMWFDDYIEY